MIATVGLFAAMALVICAAGTLMSNIADRLADRTGLGEALTGVLLLAGATSIPDFAATLSAAVDSRPVLALSTVTGSMAANLAFLGVADAFYRKANLEHASASTGNLMQAALFITLLSLPLIAADGPQVAVWGVHPVTPLIVAAYLFGLRLVRGSQTTPMWTPRRTPQTVEDKPEAANRNLPLPGLWAAFVLLTAVTGAAGWVLMDAAQTFVDDAGLSEGLAGGVLTAISTSLPELVTTIAAIRQGALALAVGNVLGTNFFNVIVIGAADLAFRSGSIYHALPRSQLGWGLLVILMTSIMLLGMLRRETYGIGRIGFESFAILVLYALGIGLAALR